MAERISVKKAAEFTGLSELTIRYGLETGSLPFGAAIKCGSKRTNYHISPRKLDEYLGLQEKVNAEIDPASVTDYKIKLLQDEIDTLKKKLIEQNIVIHSILDAQEYIISRLNGAKSASYPSLYDAAIKHFREKPIYVDKEEMVTVKRTAELTGLSELFVRWGIIDGTLTFGTATKKQLYNGTYKMEYHISAKKLAEYLGISIETVKVKSPTKI